MNTDPMYGSMVTMALQCLACKIFDSIDIITWLCQLSLSVGAHTQIKRCPISSLKLNQHVPKQENRKEISFLISIKFAIYNHNKLADYIRYIEINKYLDIQNVKKFPQKNQSFTPKHVSFNTCQLLHNVYKLLWHESAEEGQSRLLFPLLKLYFQKHIL